MTGHDLLPRVRRRRRWYESPVSSRRRFDLLLGGLIAVFAVGWTFGIVEAAQQGTSLTRGLTRTPLQIDGSQATVYLLNELVRSFDDAVPFRGRSGALRVIVPEPGEAVPVPDSLPPGVAIGLLPIDSLDSAGPPRDPRTAGPGSWALSFVTEGEIRSVPGMTVLTQLPMTEKRGGRVGRYLIGAWPFEARPAPSRAYRTPRGLIRVDRDDVDLPVSDHFTLGDFLTKGQWGVWPKYVVLSTRLLDKLELTIQELERMGHPVEKVGIISGFRTPRYNASGGNTGGRGTLSRHMYGDAMDFYVDNDGDGCMDDLSGDGRVDIRDARIVARAADRVGKAYPDLRGGIGSYRPTGAHCGFVHVDTRGHRARW